MEVVSDIHIAGAHAGFISYTLFLQVLVSPPSSFVFFSGIAELVAWEVLMYFFALKVDR